MGKARDKIRNEPVRASTAVGTLGGTSIAAGVGQIVSGVDWNSMTETLMSTGFTGGGVVAALGAAIAGRRKAYSEGTHNAEVQRAHDEGWTQGMNGVDPTLDPELTAGD